MRKNLFNVNIRKTNKTNDAKQFQLLCYQFYLVYQNIQLHLLPKAYSISIFMWILRQIG